ncbi:UV DNA damage repair endonuclease UvsE [Ornithinibacillus bavariensis]|uniref:UV DNA damage endonuclease n=1 Tax=Ornithinibacillus bavariensis TaxID=545502 RepID=A0A919X785_9BACI|nr:UV DNA damage repair endonuclease UvsE [Ornithinibacillus bavariensis]GIO25413.1 UV DNA damage endonuclease [Ornithinibacillus bavariensis]
MKIRFGYVATALDLWNASPAKTITFKQYSTLPKNERLDKLKHITAQNLHHTKRILHYNIAHEIKLYRFSSSLAPLATHPDVMWDYITPFQKDWKEIGQLIQNHKIRASFHPGQYTLFTSDKEKITVNAIKDITYHYRMLEAMNLHKESIINIHIGGAYGDKTSAIERFHENLKKLPREMKKQITLENDDKTYNVEETLIACEKENIPMILDFHHHMANPTDTDLNDFLPRIYNTWSNSNTIPKVHLSSPKSQQAYRFHCDFVSINFILPFLKMAKDLNQDFDIMVEAKQKDLAMRRLVEEIASIRGVKRVTSSAVEW